MFQFIDFTFDGYACFKKIVVNNEKHFIDEYFVRLM